MFGEDTSISAISSTGAKDQMVHFLQFVIIKSAHCKFPIGSSPNRKEAIDIFCKKISRRLHHFYNINPIFLN
jgi:hypothetical protein